MRWIRPDEEVTWSDRARPVRDWSPRSDLGLAFTIGAASFLGLLGAGGALAWNLATGFGSSVAAGWVLVLCALGVLGSAAMLLAASLGSRRRYVLARDRGGRLVGYLIMGSLGLRFAVQGQPELHDDHHLEWGVLPVELLPEGRHLSLLVSWTDVREPHHLLALLAPAEEPCRER